MYSKKLFNLPQTHVMALQIPERIAPIALKIAPRTAPMVSPMSFMPDHKSFIAVHTVLAIGLTASHIPFKASQI